MNEKEEDKLSNARYEPSDRMLKRALGYDSEQLKVELDQAVHKADQDDPIPEGGFEAIMKRLEAEEASYPSTKDVLYQDVKPDGARPAHGKKRLSKRMFRVMLAAAVLATLTMAWGISAVGKKYYVYKQDTQKHIAGKVIWDNDHNLIQMDSLEEAYKQIKGLMGKYAVQLSYLPKSYELYSAVVDERRASLVFYCNDQMIQFQQVKYDVESSDGISSDSEIYEIIDNNFLNNDITIYKMVLDEGEIEYHASFSIDGCHYYLSSKVDGKLFEQLVRGLTFY